jgi:hypothetical protein
MDVWLAKGMGGLPEGMVGLLKMDVKVSLLGVQVGYTDTGLVAR